MSVSAVQMEVHNLSSFANTEAPLSEEHNDDRLPINGDTKANLSPQVGRSNGTASATPSTRKRKARNTSSDDEESTPTKKGRRNSVNESDVESSGRPSARRSREAATKKIKDAYSLSQDPLEDNVEDGDFMDVDEAKENVKETLEKSMANGHSIDEKEEEKDHAESKPSVPQPAPTPRRGRPPKAKQPKAEDVVSNDAKDVKDTKDAKDVLGVKNVEDEDVETEWDEKGEAKITKDGELLGGREFKLKTFTLPRHPTRRYMLTVDIAKTLQYRDTYIFFLKNPHITRVQGTEEDKKYLEEAGLLPGQLRRRPASMATARSIFRAFGHKIIKRGRAVRDDYWVGDQEEPPEEPEIVERDDQSFEPAPEARARVARESAASRRHANRAQERQLLLPFTTGARLPIPATLKGDDYLYKRVASAADFNRRLILQRPRTFFDHHTHIEQIPSLTQPSTVSVQIKKGTLKAPLTVEQHMVVAAQDRKGTWLELPTSPDEEKYPVALMPGQYQGMFSIYQERFAAPATTTMSAADNSVGTSVPRPSEIPLAMPRETAMPQVSARIKHLEHVCGEITRSGLGCKRPVYIAGEKCLYHVKPVAPAVPAEDACVHCHSVPPIQRNPEHPKVLPNVLLTCAACKTRHHPSCIDFDDAVLISKAQTYDWHCSDCKTCVKCNKAGDDDKLLFCDTCDRGYHTYCLTPPLDAAPEGNWLCEQCAICASCGTRTPSDKPGHEMNWKHAISRPAPTELRSSYGNYICTYCEKCYESFESGKFCPLCMQVYAEDDLAMVCCDTCDRWIHVGCDPELTQAMYQQLVEEPDSKYSCILCNDTKLKALLDKRKESGSTHKVFRRQGKKMVAPPIVSRG